MLHVPCYREFPDHCLLSSHIHSLSSRPTSKIKMEEERVWQLESNFHMYDDFVHMMSFLIKVHLASY